MAPDDFHVYDTTLRDGMQQEGLSPSVADKLAIGLSSALGATRIRGSKTKDPSRSREVCASAAGRESDFSPVLMRFGR